MSGNRAMRRALETNDSIRVNAEVPLIRDTTEMINPEIAKEILKHNSCNRPVNWKEVETYSAIMKRGEWRLHAQGVIIGADGNLLTGQTRLWAVIFADVNVYMRVSRGNPSDVGHLLDRGRSQSARDLASRKSEGKRHSPTEASIARGVCAINGNMRPSKDELAEAIVQNAGICNAILKEISGTKKTKSVLLVLSAICATVDLRDITQIGKHVQEIADALDIVLLPATAKQCWGRGAAFGLALEHARTVVAGKVSRTVHSAHHVG